jgi:hypothetical protein
VVGYDIRAIERRSVREGTMAVVADPSGAIRFFGNWQPDRRIQPCADSLG